MAKILGIDLGTTNSAMAIVEGGEPKIIENKEGNRTTPSMAATAKNGERLVGLLAKRQAVINPENTIFSMKRLIGRRWNDPEIQRDQKWLPYKIQQSSSGGVEINMSGKWQRPEEISAMVLQKLKQDAEEKLGEKITETIITVPAYFDDSQRQATKNAGEIAGLKVLRIINEPTAAALAYGLDKKKAEKIVVYDFGGGTFDVSVLEIGDDTIEVKATGGDTHLGGDDLDQRITNHLVETYKKDQGIDLSRDSMALSRLKEAAEKAKIELSSTLETEINLPFITADENGPKHLQTKITRAKFEDLIRPIVNKCRGPLEQALTDAKLGSQNITRIIMVGGPTRMPIIQKFVEDYVGKKIERGVDPMECVAWGAAIQGAVLGGEMKDVLLLDVTPLTLGIETLGGVSTPLIERNTTIPTSKSQIFSTASDSQPAVEIHVLQGERPMARDNRTLGRFVLDGLPPAPRGVPQVEVSFDIDANGILTVMAKDKATNKSQHITIKDTSALSKEDIEKMKHEAESHAVEDRKQKEMIDLRNQADTLIYSVEKTLRDAGDKVSADVKKSVEDKVRELKKVKDGDDADIIKKALDELSGEIQKVGSELYRQQQANEKEVKEEKEINKDNDGAIKGQFEEGGEKDKK